jgi:tricorn protease
MTVQVDPRAEWRQMFVDGWRLLRDWFYDEKMHESTGQPCAPAMNH